MNKKNTRILLVDDEEIVRESLSGWLEKDGYTIGTAPDGLAGVKAVEDGRWSIMLVDLKMPGIDGLEVLRRVKEKNPEIAVVIMTAYATVDTAVNAMKLGAFDYIVKPFDPEEVSLMVEKIVAQQALVRENVILRKALKREFHFHDLVTKSAAMQSTLELARTAARSPSTILILGESGTGKELLARAVHAESPRHDKPFVAMSCAALTETLLESELFGYEKGSFTGAAQRREGKFVAAHGGTLFLDEIGDISPKLQLDLLRVLEERRVTRVGGTESVAVDVRIIAATNRDLPKAVDEGRFRQDLFYRLNVITLTLAPLRDRKEDIPFLVDRLLERLAVELKKPVEGVSPEAMALLLSHTWPGNVRELRNVLERGVVVSRGPLLLPPDLGLTLRGEEMPAHPASLAEVERQHIAAILKNTGGNVTQAARILDIDRVTLYSKIHKLGLKRADDGVFEPAPER
jgi:two-component system, NtrC family, response regulator AtoC